MSAAPTQSLTAFALARGLVTMGEARSHIHAGLRSQPTSKSFRCWYAAETSRLLAAAGDTAELYHASIEAGEIAPPTPEQIAIGHPDLASTQAAIHVLAKRHARRVSIGHNGGPPRLLYDAACVRCLHWTPPTEREEPAEFRQLDLGF